MSVLAAIGRARNGSWLSACEKVGQGTQLLGRPTVESEGGPIRIGDRFRLASRPVPSHLVAGPEGVLEIGHDVSIGHGAAIAAFQHVRIGDGTRIGPFVIVMDTNFHGQPGDQSVQHDCRPVVIGSRCRIGSRVTITRGGSVGDDAEILAGSVVSSSIPPGVCAGGARARIVGCAGESTSRWHAAPAMLPMIAMELFELTAPPELVTELAGAPGWTQQKAARLLSAIEAQFGVTLGTTVFEGARSLADLADAIERARQQPGSRWTA